jgi:biopolymer transport protein ExbD
MGAKLDTGVGAKRGRPEINAEPNVIPFIDVMLVLLIIFMVTAPIAAVDIKATMPASKILASKRDAKPVWVTLVDGDDCGQAVKGKTVNFCPAVYVMEKNVDFGQIGPETLAALKEANPKHSDDTAWFTSANPSAPRIYLRASGITRYKNVQDVMRRLQAYSLTKVALVTDDRHL